MPSTYVAAVCQFTPVYLDPVASTQRMCDQIERAVRDNRDTRLLVFPETATVGMPANMPGHDQHWKFEAYLAAAEKVPGPTSNKLGKLAKALDVYISTGFVEADAELRGVIYNSSMLVGPEGDIVAIHRKVQSGGIYASGSTVAVQPTPLGTLGLSICYDLWFPEFVRLQAMAGCDVHLNMTANQPIFALGSTHVPIVRAVENGMFVLSANLIGDHRMEGGRQYAGCSSIVAPSGEQLAVAGSDHEETIFAVVDLDAILRARALVAPIKDIRRDLYEVVYHGLNLDPTHKQPTTGDKPR